MQALATIFFVVIKNNYCKLVFNNQNQSYHPKLMLAYRLHLHQEPEGGFTVTVPALPGCVTFGEDIDEALAMAREAIELFIEELQDRGEGNPDDSRTLEYSLTSTSV